MKGRAMAHGVREAVGMVLAMHLPHLEGLLEVTSSWVCGPIWEEPCLLGSWIGAMGLPKSNWGGVKGHCDSEPAGGPFGIRYLIASEHLGWTN